MNTFADDVRDLARAINPALVKRPGFKMSMANADYATVAAVIYGLVLIGVNTAREIQTELRYFDSPVDGRGLQFILDAMCVNDSANCLWSRDKAGRYLALMYAR